MIHKSYKFIQESNLISNKGGVLELENSLKAWDYTLKNVDICFLRTKNIYKIYDIITDRDRPLDVPKNVLNAWLKQYNRVISTFFGYSKSDLEEETLLSHIWFMKLNLFDEETGRIGRMLYNLQRIKLDMPIKVFYEKKKYEYFKLLKK